MTNFNFTFNEMFFKGIEGEDQDENVKFKNTGNIGCKLHQETVDYVENVEVIESFQESYRKQRSIHYRINVRPRLKFGKRCTVIKLRNHSKLRLRESGRFVKTREKK